MRDPRVPERMQRVAHGLVGLRWLAALMSATGAVWAQPRADATLLIVSDDGRTWRELLQEIEAEPATAKKRYGLSVKSLGESAACRDYVLALDPVATRAFALGPCDDATDTTPLWVVDRSALFTTGGVVPHPLRASVSATLVTATTAWGGGDGPTAGSKVWCSVALQPYLWDSLRGAAVALDSGRYELRPLEEHIHAAPDGSGWVVRDESEMSIVFHYEVRNRATGVTVLENVAMLNCADRPAVARGDPLFAETPRSLASDVVGSEVSAGARERKPLVMDLRLDLAGCVFGPADAEDEVTGIQVGVGKLLSERLYLGVATKLSLLVEMGNAPGPGVQGLWQLGPEARYLFHKNEHSGRSGNGYSALWLGGRAGYEAVGPGHGNGGFGELSLGQEAGGATMAGGVVVAVGTGVDAPFAYGDRSVFHPYASFAFRFAFDL